MPLTREESGVRAIEINAITRNRRELKYRLSGTLAASFVRRMSARVSMHRYRGAGENPLPRAWHYATTVYFDTEDGDLYRAAMTDPVHVKARVREYYDVHPDLTELATDARDLVQYQPVLFVEVKVRDGERSRKQRVAVPKHEVDSFFKHFEVSATLRSVQPQGSTTLDQIVTEFARLRAELGKPLRASCVVNYRRLSWEDRNTALRVTLDRDLCVFAPPAGLWARREALTREALGTPVHEESDCVLEIKSRGELPEWLFALLEAHRVQSVDYSKFVMASRAVHDFLR
jgi:hypothetical protein